MQAMVELVLLTERLDCVTVSLQPSGVHLHALAQKQTRHRAEELWLTRETQVLEVVA